MAADSTSTAATTTATASSIVCILCLTDVPKSTQRRRLNSPASQHVAITVREIASSLDKTSPSLLLPHAMDTFLCRQCFTSVEKLTSLRNEASKLELTIVRQLERSGEMRGLYSSLTPTQCNTAEAQRSPTATSLIPRAQHQSQRSKRPASALAIGEQTTPTRTPSTPPLPKRLRASDTPCRQYLQQTVVTGSPAVAVSESLASYF